MSQDFEKLINIVFEKWKAKLPPAQGRHPDEEDFAAFVANLLPPKETARLKNHVLSCSRCSEILAASIKLRVVEEIEPPDKLLKASQGLINKEIAGRCLEIFLQVKDKLLEILNTTGDVLVGQELIPAAVLRSRKIRDFQDEITILKDFGNIRVEAKIETKESGNFNLQVIIKEKQTQETIKDLRISLIKGDVELESYLADSGKVVFEHVLLGKYTVEITSPKDKMAEISIDIKV